MPYKDYAKTLENAKKSYQNNRDNQLARSHSRWMTDPEFRRKHSKRAAVSHLKRAYDLTPEQRDALMASQGGCCAVCRSRPGYKLVVDHCHATGKVRGLLCKGCNWALGNMKDNPGLLRLAAEYLEKTK